MCLGVALGDESGAERMCGEEPVKVDGSGSTLDHLGYSSKSVVSQRCQSGRDGSAPRRTVGHKRRAKENWRQIVDLVLSFGSTSAAVDGNGKCYGYMDLRAPHCGD